MAALTTADNLACTFYNWHKGSDVASLADGGALVLLLHPRRDDWAAHCGVMRIVIQARTAVVGATARLLKFNVAERLLEREALTR